MGTRGRLLSYLTTACLVLSLVGTVGQQAARAEATSPPELHQFIGALHEHSAYSDGFPGSRPADYYASGHDYGLDFVLGSDHSDNLDLPVTLSEECLPDSGGTPVDCAVADRENPPDSLRKWDATAEQATAATTADFTAGRGFEWSSERYGHINVYLSKNFTNAYHDGGFVSMETFWKWFTTSPLLGGGADGIATFNHPGDKSLPVKQSDPGFNWNGFEYRPEADRRMAGLEVFNGRKDFGGPRPQDASAPDGFFVQALDKGWHVGAVAAEDKGHDPTDGDGAPDPNGIEDDWGGAKWAKTIIIARDRSERSLREAMLARRTYAVLDNSVRIEMDAGGQPMGARLRRPVGDVVGLHATVTPNAATIELYSNAPGNDHHLLLRSSGPTFSYDIPVVGGENYYFLRILDADGNAIAYTSPIWLTGEGGQVPDRGDWLAGDLHVHTTYSHDSYGGPGDDNTGQDDFYTFGYNVSQEFALAESRGLDYTAITDHNDVRSQTDPGWESTDVIGVPGYENSLQGHAQMLGATSVYQKDGTNDSTDMVAAAAATNDLANRLRNGPDHGVFQINHPFEAADPYPDNENWKYRFDVVPDTIEVWNIARLFQYPLPSSTNNDDGISYWESWLNKGYKVGATGGSDSHWVTTSAVQGVGSPTTWVYSKDHSARGVLEGLRAGHSYITLGYPTQQPPGIFLEADGDDNGTYESLVGDTVTEGSSLRVRVEGASPGSFVRIYTNNAARDGHVEVLDEPITDPNYERRITLPNDSRWAWAEVYYEDLPAERATICDDFAGSQTTYCRNKMSVIGMTSAIYLKHPVSPTELALTAPTSARFTDDIEVSATLTADGEPVAGKSVHFSLGSQQADALTDASGVAATALTLVDDPGNYEVRASFEGDDDFLSSAAMSPFLLKREATIIDYTGQTSATGKVVHLSARLTEDDGPPVANETVVFTLADGSFEVVTDSAGVAATDVRIQHHGHSEVVTVQYAGGTRFEGSEDQDWITWKPAPPPTGTWSGRAL